MNRGGGGGGVAKPGSRPTPTLQGLQNHPHNIQIVQWA
jgi:hypothetical protein